jgi:hypothetical protein
MRYKINFDKTINQFVPYYIGGRKLILYLQSLMYPLQILNHEFVAWAKETRIEASMTSQTFKFEWYLNRKLKKYFAGAGQLITIKNGSQTGVPIYAQSADIADSDHLLLYLESENQRGSESFYYYDEKTEENSYSFLVYSPAINTLLITREAYLAMLSYYIDKYRIAGKTYKIKFND